MKVHSPAIKHQHLAAIDGEGLWGIVDNACIQHMIASFASGPLVGYTGWQHGEYPEVLNFENGQPIPNPKRPFARCHDPLPWDLVHCSNNPMLQSWLHGAVEATMCINMGTHDTVSYFAHKGGQAGFAGAYEKDDTGSGGNVETNGHAANAENMLFLYFSTRNTQALKVWQNWVNVIGAKIAGGATAYYLDDHGLGGWGRDGHSHLVRAYLAYKWGAGDAWWHNCRGIAAHLISKPYSEHNVLLNQPLWPLFLWYIGKLSEGDQLDTDIEAWIVNTSREYSLKGGVVRNETMVLDAVAYWITGKAYHLTQHLLPLAQYPYIGYHGDENNGAYKWQGVSAVGRRGSGFVEVQWPIFKRALQDSGLINLMMKQHQHNSIPFTNYRASLKGKGLKNGYVELHSYGGDSNGCTLIGGDGERIDIAGIGGRNYIRMPFNFAKPQTTVEFIAYNRGDIYFYGADYEVVLEPNVPYNLGTCIGVLDTAGDVAISALNEFVSFYDENNKSLGKGLWKGLSEDTVWGATDSKQIVNVHGNLYGRWQFTLTEPGTWTVVRPPGKPKL